MINVRVAGACAALALGFVAPAQADPRIIPVQTYYDAPESGGRIQRYYEDDGARVVRRADRRRGYIEDMEDEAPSRVYRYDGRSQRIPTARERETYEAYGDTSRRSRVYRYYEDDPSFGYDPYNSRDAIIAPDSRRLAGPPSAAGGDVGRRTMDPKFARTTVQYAGKEPVGSIVIDTRTRYLYLVQAGGMAIRYGVGVGKEGFGWKGTETITQKREWPDWRPPAEMRVRRPELPVMMAGGPDNPLGARALYLGNTLYRIHGSNEPWTIGHAVSSGCIRMTNDDVTDLYERVGVGTTVKVM
ncbi:L,D-transpeptidase [Hansschlegelia quercus]|uniref:L,D-transpeptidase n=1 Tax=Hansschlegelia quercus TaxID=2528245 RepID=A0A4Q9GSD9_9HYPH|nr:L,D-transpeptidase [Hansschlegelia quercus]TBN55090.1 L,D-transpeptidase [Hansschlegelia quercus]